MADDESGPWPRVDKFMSDADLTAAAERIKQSVNWSKLPKLAAIFEHRPSVNRYWHELVALTLLSLEVNGNALNERNGRKDPEPGCKACGGAWLAGAIALCKCAEGAKTDRGAELRYKSSIGQCYQPGCGARADVDGWCDEHSEQFKKCGTHHPVGSQGPRQ